MDTPVFDKRSAEKIPFAWSELPERFIYPLNRLVSYLLLLDIGPRAVPGDTVIDPFPEGIFGDVGGNSVEPGHVALTGYQGALNIDCPVGNDRYEPCAQCAFTRKFFQYPAVIVKHKCP